MGVIKYNEFASKENLVAEIQTQLDTSRDITRKDVDNCIAEFNKKIEHNKKWINIWNKNSGDCCDGNDSEIYSKMATEAENENEKYQACIDVLEDYLANIDGV